MKKLLFLLFLLFAGPAFSQTIPAPMLGGIQGYITVGATQQVKPVTFVVIAPGVYVVPNVTQATTDYNTCMAAPSTAAAFPGCQQAFLNTVNADVNARFQAVIKTLYTGLPAGTTADQLLAANGIYLQIQ